MTLTRLKEYWYVLTHLKDLEEHAMNLHEQIKVLQETLDRERAEWDTRVKEYNYNSQLMYPDNRGKAFKIINGYDVTVEGLPKGTYVATIRRVDGEH